MTAPKDLTKEIMEELRRYTKATGEKVEIAKKDVSKALVKELKSSSPERRPRYKKGWRTKKIGNGYITHNKTDYQLTHLLEYSHPTRSGRNTDAKPHIRPAEKRAITSFLDKIEKAVKE